MVLGFGYLYVCYVLFIYFYFLFFKKKAGWPKFCNIIFLFLLKVGSVGLVDQEINFVLP